MTALDEIKIGGIGASRKRVEDDRFIRGKGNYTDDIVLPGMLHMEILRSPLAHARIVSIDTSKAWQIPGVHLVLTGEMMATRNLAWMPTLSYDTQAVLATDKVRFQGQEVACVIADDPYIAKDACEAIAVEYEPLPVIVNPQQAVADGAPVIRDDKENQHDNVAFQWEVGDAAGTEAAFAKADKISRLQLHYPRSHPSPIECCGSIADFNRATSKLTVYMTTQAPHIIRAAVALVAELPEHMIRIVSPDIGGGFGNKVPVYPGYVCSILEPLADVDRPADLRRLKRLLAGDRDARALDRHPGRVGEPRDDPHAAALGPGLHPETESPAERPVARLLRHGLVPGERLGVVVGLDGEGLIPRRDDEERDVGAGRADEERRKSQGPVPAAASRNHSSSSPSSSFSSSGPRRR